MKDSKLKPRKKPERAPRAKKEERGELHQATTAEFEAEGMGVAPKE